MNDQTAPVAAALNDVVARLHLVLRRVAAGEPRLPEAQVELLKMIERRPGIGVKEAAELLRTAPNTVSTLVGELTDAGLLTRTRDPGNRRTVKLELTGDARARLDEYTGRRRAILANAIAELGEPALADLARAVPHLRHLEDLVGGVKD